MIAHSLRRTACIALLGAMVYGLGAAPCGCWEHSGWRVALAQLTGGEQHREADHDEAEDRHCDPQAPPSAMATPRQTDVVEGPDWDGASGPSSVAALAAFVAVSTGDREPSGVFAPRMRAQLQVFRL